MWRATDHQPEEADKLDEKPVFATLAEPLQVVGGAKAPRQHLLPSRTKDDDIQPKLDFMAANNWKGNSNPQKSLQMNPRLSVLFSWCCKQLSLHCWVSPDCPAIIRQQRWQPPASDLTWMAERVWAPSSLPGDCE